MTASATRQQCALIFAFLYLPYVYFNHSDGWNQRARFAELHAIVMQHTLAIDAYQDLTGDKALLNGHYYSEKAPAITLMALPAFSLTVFAQKLLGIDPPQDVTAPLTDFYLVRLQQNRLAPSLGMLLGLSPGGGLLLLAALLGILGSLMVRTARKT